MLEWIDTKWDRAITSLRGARSMGRSKAARKSGRDDYGKFGLPMGFGFIEDTLKSGARRLITDVQFDLGGPKCFSCNEMKC